LKLDSLLKCGGVASETGVGLNFDDEANEVCWRPYYPLPALPDDTLSRPNKYQR
jgi:hypothetical protein